MKWVVTENSVGLCPGLQLNDLPEKIPSNIHIINRNNTLGILSENVAGILPCKNGNEIIIEPKYRHIQPTELLMYINNISGITLDEEKLIAGNSEFRLQKLADAFVEQLERIRFMPLKIKRKASGITSKAVIGRVDWVETYKNQKLGKNHEIVTTVHTASSDIPENIIIAAAAKRIISHFRSDSKEYAILFPWVKTADRFPYTNQQLFVMCQRLNRTSLSGAHAFYYPSVMLSKIILGFNGAEMVAQENSGILFNMPGLYEAYIRTGFQRIAGKYGLSVQKGLSPRSFLFFNGECELIPDITVYEGTSIKALMDVKYKAPDSKDYYQIFSYMKYAGVETAYIISPAVTDERCITAFDGSRIIYICVDNSNASDLEIKAKTIIRGIA